MGDEPHAEVARVWPRDGLIRVEGGWHLVKARSRDDWRVELIWRAHRNQRLILPVDAGPDGFVFAVPLRELATPWLRAAGPDARQVWDLHLVRARDGLRARVGRHLDDIPNKAGIMVYPAQRIDAGGPALVRPFYTPANHLAVRCRKLPA
ncbi:hypothetical protein SAMN04489712_112232 [Thermomonospora echinospora]|uniref:Uncharacterized protein n=1 Tax=Thermomonospora echinospora TaxID=1992 RepID=A0A1H6D2E9_9ACTN|nr:hypothetical protein [Thermomonospora echinospora]SEG79539.1 hypothetical protein SAMN04489712_112232 [Thermomonospora echinospora]